VDYRALLKKYMHGVGFQEGTHFLPMLGHTEEETRILKEISDELVGDAYLGWREDLTK